MTEQDRTGQKYKRYKERKKNAKEKGGQKKEEKKTAKH